MGYQQDFIGMRSRLFGLAYKMTKSVVDAEDIVQEAFLAMGTVRPGSVRDPSAYFVRSVTNRCLKVLDQRKATVYPGPDLPEPLEDGWHAEVGGEDISYGLLVLLQRLKPVERAVFILRESWGLEYGEIGEIVSSKPDHCRQLLHRAKEKLRQAAPVIPASEERVVGLMHVFQAAVASGDPDSLVAWLREDVTVYTDGGGKRIAALRPLTGTTVVWKFLAGLYSKWSEGVSFSVTRVNGEAAVVLRDHQTGSPETVILFGFAEDRLAAIYMVRNPEKLKGLREGLPDRA